MKIGSLFDGSGGFPLAASLCGIKPTWASEVEPYPIAVTRSRFPNMKHLGSVTDVRGDEVEPVDVITFGSPCQDLSVAGKRAGLKHTENGDEETTRSGLFMEAIRIIKEMRKATNGEYPRYAVWENVPGAFSSNKGLDFRVVLEELIRISEPTAVMPEVPKAGWAYADVYCGDGWSLAYRVLDAQYWGVPQRRRRIYLVADFRGQRAGKILFERKGLRGYSAESGATWQTTAGDAQSCSGADDREGKCYGIVTKGNGEAWPIEEKHMALSCGGGQAGQGYPCAMVPYGISSYASNAMKSSNPHSGIYEADTARTLDLNGGNPACNQGGIAIVEPVGCDLYNFAVSGDKAVTLNANSGQSANHAGPTVAVPYTLKIRGGVEVDSAGKSAGKGALIQTNLSATLGVSQDQYLFQPVTLEPGIAAREGGHIYDGVCGTLRANAGDNQMAVAYAAGFKELNSAKARSDGFGYEVAPCLAADKHDASVVYALDQQGGKGGANYAEDVMPTLCSDSHGTPHAVAYSIENHPADSRVNIDDSGNVPMVMESIPIEGNGSRPSHQGDGYSESDKMYTLNTIERHAVAYTETYQKVTGPLMANSHPGSYTGQDAYNDMFVVGKELPAYSMKSIARNGVPLTEQANPICASDYKDPDIVAYPAAYGVDSRNATEYTEMTGSLQADAAHNLNSNNVVRVNYIVRRLTPTECARLQGFPDAWGHPDTKSALTDEEYAFWLNVRNTHAEINGKATKEYTREQMLNWYNKLHTDSAEYKLWGNGIALPCALYVMEGIANEN